MEIQLPAKDQARLADLARKTGRAEIEIVREVIGTYLDGVEETREMLGRRLDDVEGGRVKPLTSEHLRGNLERRKKAFLPQRS